MLPQKVEIFFGDLQNQLYLDLQQKEWKRPIGLVYALTDVSLETLAKPLICIESALLVLINLVGLVVCREDCSLKHAVFCAEEGVQKGALSLVIPFSFVVQLVCQVARIFLHPNTIDSIHQTRRFIIENDAETRKVQVITHTHSHSVSPGSHSETPGPHSQTLNPLHAPSSAVVNREREPTAPYLSGPPSEPISPVTPQPEQQPMELP